MDYKVIISIEAEKIPMRLIVITRAGNRDWEIAF
jgi:hypothetical protein